MDEKVREIKERVANYLASEAGWCVEDLKTMLGKFEKLEEHTKELDDTLTQIGVLLQGVHVKVLMPLDTNKGVIEGVKFLIRENADKERFRRYLSIIADSKRDNAYVRAAREALRRPL